MPGSSENPTINRFVQLTSDLPSIAGMRTSGNAASLPPFLFRALENIAMRGNDVHDRGGQEKFNPDHPIDDCGDGFLPPDEEPDDYQTRLIFQATIDDSAYPLWLYSSGVSGLPAASLTKPSMLSYLPGSDPGGANGSFVWSSYGISDEVTVFATQFSLDRSDNSVAVVATDSTNFGGSAGEATIFDSQVFLVLREQTQGEIRVDPFGSGSMAEVAAAIDPSLFISPWLKVFDSELVCPLEPTLIYRRGVGSAGWTTSAMPIGTIASQRLASSAVYWPEGEGLFFSGTSVGGGYAVFKLDAAGVITQVAQPGAGSPPEFQPLAVHNGVLWIGSGNQLFYLNEDMVLEDFDDTALFISGAIRQLLSFRGRLWALLQGDEIHASKFPHSPDSWKRISYLPLSYGYGVVHPIY